MSKERLVELLRTSPMLDVIGNEVWEWEIAADYLLYNGVIMPPCKVGDKVYEIVHGEILETEAVGFLICQDGAILIITRRSFPLSREIGCCVFLTREEAEKKTKARVANEQCKHD